MTEAEKMQKLQEMMNDFISNVAKRAEQSQPTSQPQGSNNFSSSDEDDSFEDDNDLFEEDDYFEESDSSFEEEEDDFSTEDNSFEEDDNSTFSFNFNQEDWKNAWQDAMYATKSFYDSEKAKKNIENERKNPKQPKQCTDEVIFKKNTAMFNGNPFEYKVLQREVDWGIAFTNSFAMDDKFTNLDKLNRKIVEDIKLCFGDLSRVTEIAVISGMLIINGVQYYPMCNNKDFLNGLPFDCADYFKSGTIAEFFDFGYLYYMPYLTMLKIDSVDFATKNFARGIGLPAKFKITSVFKKFKNLRYFELGDTLFEAPGVDTNAEIEESIDRHSRVSEIYNNFVIGNASSFRGWTFNNLKTYACNRGDKGFLRYSGGVLARGSMSLAAGVGELGLRGVGAVVKGGAHLLKKAFKGDV